MRKNNIYYVLFLFIGRKSILQRIGEKNVNVLTPKKKILYREYNKEKRVIGKLRKKLFNSRNVIKTLKNVSNTNSFKKIEENFNIVTANFISSQFRNIKMTRPSWTIEDKIFALAVYKRGPKCYRFLKKFLKLPSKSTLIRILKNIPLETGLDIKLLTHLKERLSRFNEDCKKCILLFDEISLRQGLTYNKTTDSIVGYVDLGHLGRMKQEANHALVFMLVSLKGKWKQPIAFYFTRDQIKTPHLKQLLTHILHYLVDNQIDVVACVCDQGKINFEIINTL